MRNVLQQNWPGRRRLAGADLREEVGDMRYESSVTSVSWIPSEAVRGLKRVTFDSGVTHYDDPPPDVVDDLEALAAADRFRFANRLRAWIEVEDGRITRHGYLGGVVIGSTTLKLGPAHFTFRAFSLPDLQKPVELGDGWARFTQTAGGRAGVPAPRRVPHKPFVQFRSPLVWTTLTLTLRADGQAECELIGASPFPRHWIYGSDSKVAGKVGLIDFNEWWRKAFGKHSPWGDEDSPALVTAAETALERELSTMIMRGGAKPKIRRVKQGEALVREGDEGTEVYLLLDGVLWVEVGGERLAEIGPGALLGERAGLEGGRRTSTLVALTPCRVAVAACDQLDRSKLEEVSSGHHRETVR
jgi:hypothetical protein